MSATLPLSEAQRGLWLGQQLAKESPMYGAAQYAMLPGQADVAALEAAVRKAAHEAEVLRASVEVVEGAPRWRIHERAEVELEVRDLRDAPDPEQACLSAMRADLARPFDLSRSPLSRHLLLTTHRGVYWYHCAHHVALDGFGFALIARRVAALYSAAITGRDAPTSSFEPLATSVDEDADYRAGPALAEDRDFWHATMHDAPDAPRLTRRSAYPTADVVRAGQALDAATRRALGTAARAEGASWPTVLAALFAAYVAEQTGRDEVVLGLPMMGRTTPASLRTPCMAMNIVPLRLPVPPDASARALIRSTQAELERVKPHGHYRYEDLRRELGYLGNGRRLFGPVLNILPFAHAFRFGNQQVEVETLSAGPVEDLSVLARPVQGGALQLDFEGHAACYDAPAIEGHARAFAALVQRGTREVDAPVRDPRTATSTADTSLLRGEPLREPATDVVERILQAAARTPAHHAVTHGDQRVRYDDLVARATALAGELQAAGVRPGKRVALLLPRSVDAIISILATLMTGASYVPLDPKGPPGRRDEALQDAAPACVLTTRTRAEEIADANPRVLCLDALPQATKRWTRPTEDTSEHDAYVIYTSGSTGVPSGVRVGRTALAHFTRAAEQAYGIRDDDRVLQFAPLHFDASVEEIFLALCTGATLVLRTEAMLDSLANLLDACERERISVLDLPTALWHELTFHLVRSEGALPPSVRTVILGGEAALPERIAQWQRHVGTHVALLNTYGPTEATVVATCARLEASLDESPTRDIPIGRPLPGTAAVLLGEDGTPAAPGEEGELCLLGPCLARGYVQRPERERARFVQLDGMTGSPRAYRTGDRAVQVQDGQLAFRGRMDDEVKISGHRIDPREVESVLLRHPEVREAAVVAVERGALGKLLSAHVVRADERLQEASLREYAGRWLLGAAVPAAIAFTDALPKTSTGKVDRKTLAAIAARTPSAQVDDTAATPTERLVLDCLREVLNDARLGLDDNFFERGGQSLQAIQVANRLGEMLQREVPASLLFEHPDGRALARALTGVAVDSRVDLRADRWLPDEVRAPPAGRTREVRSVLLTGATGFVGAHMLAALLETTPLRVHCLVRADSHAKAEARLAEALARHDLRLPSGGRIEVLAGELCDPRLGLSEQAYGRLRDDCDAILHAAASVSLVRDYATLRASNVDATRELLRFACQGAPKAFHHVSTLAAAVPTPPASVLPEGFAPEPPALHDGYSQSKWVAEGLVEDALARGVEAKVYRLGRVVGPAETASVNPQDIFFRLLALGVPSGVMPDLRVAEPWTPVDFVARALARFVAQPPDEAVFNLAPLDPVPLSRVLGWVEDYGYALDRCAPTEWPARLAAPKSAGDAATLAFFEAQLQKGPGTPFPAHTQADALLAAMQQAGLSCPSIDRSLVHRFLDTCVRTGLLPAPARKAEPPPTQLRGEHP